MYAAGWARPCAKFEQGQCFAAVMALQFQLSDIPKEQCVALCRFLSIESSIFHNIIILL
jgi:hypothetical protein